MQRKSSSRISLIATAIISACGLLIATSSAWAQDEDTKCTNRTLRGDYGFSAEGVLLPMPGVSLPFRSAGLAHFNGKGTLTWVEHTVINGVPLDVNWTAASGTYTVNADCTGSAVVNTPNSPVPLNLFFVVVKEGREFHSVLNSNAVSTVFIKVE